MAEMTTKRNRCKMLVIVLVAISIGIGGFFVVELLKPADIKLNRKEISC